MHQLIIRSSLGIAAVLIGTAAVMSGWQWVSAMSSTKTESTTTAETTPDLSAMNDYQKGQYYFNHDENSDSPYDLQRARLFFSRVIDENPRANNMAWHQLGRIDFLEGKFNSAIYKFNKQIEYFGDEVPNVYYMLGLTYGYKARQSGEAEDWQKAEQYFTTAVEYLPDQPWGKIDLAWIYFAQGKYEEMVDFLEMHYEQHKNNAWFNNMYGLALLNTDRKAEAHEIFIKAEAQAALLREEDWGKAYPGNDPQSWGTGLGEMRDAIKKNIALSATSTTPQSPGETAGESHLD